MPTLISFSPNTKAKSADVNANFTGLANGSMMQTPTIASPTFTTQFTATGEYPNGNSGTSKAIDWSKGDRQSVTVNGDACAFTFTGAVAGQTLTLRVVVDGTGHTAWTWPTLKWPYGAAGSPGITANAINLYAFYFDGSNYLAQLAPSFA